MSDYLIINKTSIENRIKELENSRDEAILAENEYAVGNFTGQIYALYELISDSSQSIPLSYEISKAYDAGTNNDKLSQMFDNPKGRYMNSIKLDI